MGDKLKKKYDEVVVTLKAALPEKSWVRNFGRAPHVRLLQTEPKQKEEKEAELVDGKTLGKVKTAIEDFIGDTLDTDKLKTKYDEVVVTLKAALPEKSWVR